MHTLADINKCVYVGHVNVCSLEADDATTISCFFVAVAFGHACALNGLMNMLHAQRMLLPRWQ